MLTQLLQSNHAPSSARLTQQRLLDFDLPAKWWTLGRLEQSDIIRDIEFFDPGPVGVCVCVCVCVCVNGWVGVSVYLYMYTCVCIFLCVLVCVFVHVCVCVCCRYLELYLV